MYKVTQADCTYAENIAIWRSYKCNNCICVDDIKQIAIESLFISAKTYNSNTGVAFKHYAYRGIHQAISKYIKDESAAIDHSDIHESIPNKEEGESTMLNYDLLSQEEYELWFEFNDSKMNTYEYAKYKGLPDSTLYSKLKVIQNKIIQATFNYTVEEPKFTSNYV